MYLIVITDLFIMCGTIIGCVFTILATKVVKDKESIKKDIFIMAK